MIKITFHTIITLALCVFLIWNAFDIIRLTKICEMQQEELDDLRTWRRDLNFFVEHSNVRDISELNWGQYRNQMKTIRDWNGGGRK